MPPWIADVPLIGGWFTLLIEALTVAALLVVVARRTTRGWGIALVLAAGAGTALGLGLCWLLGDRLDLFDVTLSPVSRAWAAIAFALVGVMIVGIVRGRRRRRVVAAVGILVALFAGALGINADFGQYTTVGSLAGAPVAGRLPSVVATRQKAAAPGLGDDRVTAAARLWSAQPAADLPAHGIISEVRIPGTASHFAARDGYVYLPPAALTTDPVRLPVLILLAGQPGGPDVMVSAGRVKAVYDAFASAHHGLAPIVVIPDQLGTPQNNPMCVNSALGNVATYITVDVVRWIRTHLAVQTTPQAWAIGGFSEGGTCSMQFGAGYPELFRSILDISGQIAPANGSVKTTIARGFAGSRAAYEAALPATLLRAKAPFHGTAAIFGSGSLDAKYGPEATLMSTLARTAGMHVTRLVSPGTAHDWSTVRWMLRASLPALTRHLGLTKPAS